MTTAELIKTLADLGHGEFLATAKHPKALGLLCVHAATVGHKPTSSSVTNGTLTVCVTTKPNGADFFLVESGDSEDNGNDLAETLARAGVKPAGNPAPTLEDVDAELQPKGLPVIELNGLTLVGPWVNKHPDLWIRWTLRSGDISETPILTCIDVWMTAGGTWRYSGPFTRAVQCDTEGHPTPEAAQEACEAAIVAAWRNR